MRLPTRERILTWLPTLTLAGSSTYTGTTTLSAGTLNVGAAEIAGFSGPLGSSTAANSIIQGGGHHGSHPHMVHEFIRSIVEEREPWINAVTSANWTAPGICAHESAMADGAEVVVPSFESGIDGA